MLRPFSDYAALSKYRHGLAFGGGWLVLASEQGAFGGHIEAFTSADWLACANVLTSLRGFVGTHDLVDVLRVLPPSVRPAISWPTVYDGSVQAVVMGTDQLKPGESEQEVYANAVRACDARPLDRVAVALASGVVLALNQSQLTVDYDRLERILVEQQRAAVECFERLSPHLGGKPIAKVHLVPAIWDVLRMDPLLFPVYERWKRAETAGQRVHGLLRFLEARDQSRPSQVMPIWPAWRFGRHWTFHAATPAVHVLPREAREAFLAESGRVWVQLSLDSPYTRVELVRSASQLSLEAFAQTRGLSVASLEGLLAAGADKDMADTVLSETGELLAWALLRARDYPAFERPTVAMVRGAMLMQVPPTRLREFIQHLHTTMVTTPVVARWREAGAMHWTLMAGRTWGSLALLNPESERWATELELLSS